MEKLYGLLGRTLGHSWSVSIHQALGCESYRLIELEPEELDRAAKEMAGMDVDLVVLDCIGYTSAMKERVRQLSGKPVVLSRTIAARVVMELLA